MRKMLVVISLVASRANAQPSAPTTSNRAQHVATIIPPGDGKSPESAYKAASVEEEYAIVKALGLTPKSQALIVKNGKSYDLLVTLDPTTGAERDIWFDIGSFF